MLILNTEPSIRNPFPTNVPPDISLSSLDADVVMVGKKRKIAMSVVVVNGININSFLFMRREMEMGMQNTFILSLTFNQQTFAESFKS